MTWKEYMMDLCGYETKTTFWDDFTIADTYGVSAIKDTYDRAFEEWKSNVVYVTELAMVLNHKMFQHADSNPEFTLVYKELWEEIDDWCYDNLTGEDLDYYYHTTD